MAESDQSDGTQSRKWLIIGAVVVLALCGCVVLVGLALAGGIGAFFIPRPSLAEPQPAQVDTVPAPEVALTTEPTSSSPTTDPAFENASMFAGEWEGQWVNQTFGSSGPVSATTTVFPGGEAEFVVDFDGFVFGAVDPDPKTYAGTYDAEGSTFEASGDPLFGDLRIDVSQAGEVVISGEMVPVEGIASFEATGTISPTALHLDYTVAFPGGSEATGVIDMEKLSSGAGGTGTSLVLAFLDEFSAAMRSGDTDFLLDHLHPAVLERYGEAACAAYLPAVVDPEFNLEVYEVGELAEWDYDRDGLSLLISDAIPVSLRLESQGEVMELTSHYVDAGGQVQWFTDCGDPLEP